ncbi:Mlo-related protein [Trema orientale]|uniref:MLO-like protein n=1 Tax=Trema orientale TaxID=63057 RepID=A0A2P5CHY3_TREOI|nr:Mlo-related protein [Trema orientale]
MAEEDGSTTSTTTTVATLETTPTWAVATVCFVLIFVSILIEYLLHLLAKYFNKKRRRSLLQALDKIKSELMLLGFISLLLTVSEKSIAKICIPQSVGQSFLPCSTTSTDVEDEEAKCAELGKVSLLSRKGVQQLQYLIFVLAVFHVLSCVLTFGLGMAKMRRWESWEAETRTLEYQFSNDPRRFKLIHQTSFGKRHLKYWSEHRILRWPVCFIRQFYKSVSKVDYFTLRHGFIMAHFTEGSNFDFQRYIKRALEKDFRVVVGISWWIWIFSLLFLFFNAHRFHNYLWLPFIPLVMLLLVGTKLQSIITKMSLDSHDKSQIVRGTFLVRPSDHFFWLGRPKLLLHLMHFILFQNSFQLAFFTWTWYKFGLKSCFHQETEDIVIRLAMGIIIQLLCAYVTLPLYALVTQMGSSMRKAVFTEFVVDGLKRWRRRARKNLTLMMRNTNWTEGRPSVDANNSLEAYSVDTSPSFGALDHASFSVDHVDHSVALEITDHEEDNLFRPKPESEDDHDHDHDHDHRQKVNSFDGFHLTNPN